MRPLINLFFRSEVQVKFTDLISLLLYSHVSICTTGFSFNCIWNEPSKQGVIYINSTLTNNYDLFPQWVLADFKNCMFRKPNDRKYN